MLRMNKCVFKYIFILLFFLIIDPLICFSAIDLPLLLNSQERKELMKIIGLTTSSKLVSNPYPLGGYLGLEIGYNVEYIEMNQANNIGKQTYDIKNFYYPQISVGKGIYNNIDILVHFIPFNEKRGLSNYGGIFRWNFYEGIFYPYFFSFIMHINNVNISDYLNLQSSGYELLAGLYVDFFSIYFGLGPVKCYGEFLGGNSNFTESNEQEEESITGLHYYLGMTFHYKKVYFGLQLDKYYFDIIYGVSLGLRL